jgi:hypothetical protein
MVLGLLARCPAKQASSQARQPVHFEVSAKTNNDCSTLILSPLKLSMKQTQIQNENALTAFSRFFSASSISIIRFSLLFLHSSTQEGSFLPCLGHEAHFDSSINKLPLKKTSAPALHLTLHG